MSGNFRTKIDFNISRAGKNVTVQVIGEGYYNPGVSSGPADDCYPQEGDVEIVAIKTEDDKDWHDHLTPSEEDAARDYLFTAGCESLGNNDYDYDDYDMDYEISDGPY